LKQLLAALLCLAFTLPAAADDVPAELNATLQQLVPHMAPDSVRSTPVAGLYEVVYGLQLIYLTADGSHMIDGDMVDLEAKKNLTERRKGELRVALMNGLDEADMAVYGPVSAKHTITVFTDIDCPACRSMHRNVESYNQAGIRVRYLALPRAGVNSASYDKAVSVWCSDDRAAALTAAKEGREVTAKTCDNPIQSQMDLARVLGVTATPTMITETGAKIPGFMPTDRLLQALDADQAS